MSLTAAALAARGLKKGGRLALLSHNCWQFVVLSFATARLGVVLVPVNFMLGPAEIAYILGHSRATFLAWPSAGPCSGRRTEAVRFRATWSRRAAGSHRRVQRIAPGDRRHP